MRRDDLIRMARQAGLGNVLGVIEGGALHRFFHMAQAAERNKVASWMMTKGYATGHGDTVEDLLRELEWQVRESEREACAAIARQWDVDHPASNYGGCIAAMIEARGQDAS